MATPVLETPPVTHGPRASLPDVSPSVAPCGAAIRKTTATFVGDAVSASAKRIDCKDCLRLGRARKFALVDDGGKGGW